MGSGRTRIAFLLALSCAFGAGIATASAAGCAGNSRAIGTSRTIVVDPRDHTRVGSMDYVETLPLADHEVVLTFDDGPLPPYSGRVLDILASECVQATYFIVGEMAKAYPAMVRRVYDEGHSIGTHSYSHPIHFRAQSVERGNAQIDDGIAATTAALGDADRLSPFFRFPGFGHTAPAEEHLSSLGVMVWGADVPADDWKKIGPKDIVRRAVDRLERKGKGILLLHDIHERTVEALPILLEELKARGFRIVHVVAANANRPATVTAQSDWRPNSRPIIAAPLILIADVQNPDGDMLARRSSAELCMVNPPVETTGSARTAFHKRLHPTHSGRAKAGSSAYAHAEPPRPETRINSWSDTHAVQ
jgi:peptidoglycan/xylan/chitin deacetylase (PgdA/CDA1 family)